MGVAIECVMLFAALLADFLLGNFGFVPCFTVFVLFHSSRCVSLRFATVGALVLGTLIDLAYCRETSGTPLWFVLALYAGHAALFRRESDGSGHAYRIALAGAAVGGVLTLYWIVCTGREPGWGYLGMLVDLVFGALIGVVKLALVVVVGDFVCGFLGVRGFFPPEHGVAGSPERGRRRYRRVRADKVAGKK
jgi:cell shape-determining protein MreD